MDARWVFSFNAPVATVFAFALMAAPSWLLGLYGIDADPGGEFVAQLFGAALLGIAILCISVRNLGPSDARMAILHAYATSDFVGTLFAFNAVIRGTTNSLGWLTVAIYAALTAGYLTAFLRDRRQRGAPAP